jgi:regulator of sirC expression with transglutaminase-like and TPR domain
LRNLKHIYLRRRDYARAVLVVDRLLLVHPDALWELKDRGLLQYRLGAVEAAKVDLLAYLEREPDAEDAQLLRYYVKLCDYLVASRN